MLPTFFSLILFRFTSLDLMHPWLFKGWIWKSCFNNQNIRRTLIWGYPDIQTYIACHPAMLDEEMTRNYISMLHVIWYYRSIQTRLSFLVDKWISNDIGATCVSIDVFNLKRFIDILHTCKREKEKKGQEWVHELTKTYVIMLYRKKFWTPQM